MDKLREEPQLLHCQVTRREDGVPCILTVIYGFNTCEHRRSIWEALKELAQGVIIPWLICGDFNAMLYPHARLFGNPVQYTKIREFAGCVHDLLLSEVAWKGEYYTWTNKHQSTDNICSALDRAFGNHEWMIRWGHVVMEYYIPIISYHAPMLFSLELNLCKVKVFFRFFNAWADHNNFLLIIEKVWQ